MGQVRERPRLRDQTWMRRADCRGRSHLFMDPSTEDQAKAICSTCPVFDACRRFVDLDEGLKNFRDFAGVWAGENPYERYQRRRQQRADSLETGH